MAKPKNTRIPSFTAQDKVNLRWLWDNYLRPKLKWMFVILALVILQGIVYQQFLVLTEDGMRTIFDHGQLAALIWVCGGVLLLFGVRGSRAISPRACQPGSRRTQ